MGTQHLRRGVSVDYGDDGLGAPLTNPVDEAVCWTMDLDGYGGSTEDGLDGGHPPARMAPLGGRVADPLEDVTASQDAVGCAIWDIAAPPPAAHHWSGHLARPGQTRTRPLGVLNCAAMMPGVP
jgi:hypothetical protein